MLDEDRYPSESILVHEFAHSVMDLGLHGTPLRVRRQAVAAECGVAMEREGKTHISMQSCGIASSAD